MVDSAVKSGTGWFMLSVLFDMVIPGIQNQFMFRVQFLTDRSIDLSVK